MNMLNIWKAYTTLLKTGIIDCSVLLSLSLNLGVIILTADTKVLKTNQTGRQ